MFSITGVIGCIDGTHINLKAPQENPACYINRKGVHSMLLQGVCNEKLEFIDCYAGEVGSVHDARMLRRSPLFERLEENSDIEFPNNGHILGDLAYPLRVNVMVGFKNNGRLTRQQHKFNRTLSSARCAVERAFALLKSRFRRLKYLDMSNTNQIPQVIMACCVLHNICLHNGDVDVELDNEDQDDAEEPFTTSSSGISYENRGVALDKRNRIMDML